MSSILCIYTDYTDGDHPMVDKGYSQLHSHEPKSVTKGFDCGLDWTLAMSVTIMPLRRNIRLQQYVSEPYHLFLNSLQGASKKYPLTYLHFSSNRSEVRSLIGGNSIVLHQD